jgi:hypothetical protein
MRQFLDEADLLADNIAVLAAPGKLVAHGSPVTLKTSLGEGYCVQVKFAHDRSDLQNGLLSSIQRLAPETYATSSSSTQISYHLKSKNSNTVEKVLLMLDSVKVTFGITSYDIRGTNIEDIFLQLMMPTTHCEIQEHDAQSISTAVEDASIDDSQTVVPDSAPEPLTLTTGKAQKPWQQAFVIFYKRLLIVSRGWLSQLLLVSIAVAASTIPTFFMAARPESCVPQFKNSPTLPLYLPLSPLNSMSPVGHTLAANSTPVLTYPPNIMSTLGITSIFLSTLDFSDNATLIQYLEQNFLNISLGGVSIDEDTATSLLAWETSVPGFKSSAMLNLITNIFLNRGLEASGQAGISQSLIIANYASFPFPDSGVLGALKWMVFFGAAMVRVCLVFLA